MENPSIYVACVAAYNSGKLHGAWIDLGEHVELEDVQAEINAMLAASPVQGAEEWRIDDFEDIPDPEGCVATAAAYGQLVAEHGSAFRFFVESHGAYGSPEELEEAFRDSLCGEFDSLLEYAEECFHEFYQVPAELSSYIDYEKFARDLSCEGYWEAGGFIFRPV